MYAFLLDTERRVPYFPTFNTNFGCIYVIDNKIIIDNILLGNSHETGCW